jgi:hypothetical protein
VASEDGPETGRELELRRGTLKLAAEGEDDLVEIRDSTGLLQLRVRMTAEGPVLEVETVRLSLRAAESVDIEAKELNLTAERSLGLSSQGDLEVRGSGDVRVDANGEIHVTGEMIYLN